ncbi:hypothetical protein Rhopal_005661-T1 [Rhodotorula paludigena]|uniref:Cytochrome b561 domain-containing protein n=1 Tax=Rhodotorula paludigena TaxID=86838 RepID=A0AAV5GIX5_9BASI|nr:hypothetical protein Rhopal_005661-T1 [Rhodotorula paludigena]
MRLLAARYDHAAIGAALSSGTALEANTENMKRYATLVALHGVAGFLALQVVAPLAVIVASVGKSWGPRWYKIHSRAQVFFVIPVSVICVVLAAFAIWIKPLPDTGMDRHKVMGFILLSFLFLQALFGWYAHSRQHAVEQFAVESGRPVPPPKRRSANWLHIALGIAILTMAGVQISWGFDEFESQTGQPVPVGLQVVHYLFAVLPAAVMTPFVLIRGVLRLRRGASFAEAFFSPAAPAAHTASPQGPRKLFLNTPTYVSTEAGDFDAEKDEVGHAYPRGTGLGGRVRVDSLASSVWPGASTREEYEAEVQSSIGRSDTIGSTLIGESIMSRSSSAYDYPRADRAHEQSSLLSSAASFAQTDALSHAATENGGGDGGPSQAPSSHFNVVSTSPSPVPSTTTFTSRSSYPPTLPPIPHVSSASPVAPSSVVSHASSLPTPHTHVSSPRLSFMPFAGPDAVHLPPPPPPPPSSAGARQGLTPSSSLASHSPLVLPLELHNIAGPGEGASPVTTVHVDEGGEAEICTAQRVARHASLAAEIEGVAAAAPVAVNVHGKDEEDGRAGLMPLPGERSPGLERSSSESERSAAEEGDDAESTRLMDELERELTISTTRSGRGKRDENEAEEIKGKEAVEVEQTEENGTVGPSPAVKDTGKTEAEHAGTVQKPVDPEERKEAEKERNVAADEPEDGEEANDETALLEREQSGKWMGGNKRLSQQ